jgi:hypothetical protein
LCWCSGRRRGKAHDEKLTTIVHFPCLLFSIAGRGAALTLDQHGVKFGRHTGIEGIDFYNEDDIIGKYYEEVRKLVLEATG